MFIARQVFSENQSTPKTAQIMLLKSRIGASPVAPASIAQRPVAPASSPALARASRPRITKGNYLRTATGSRTPASLASFAALSVASQVKSGSLRPKCPYAAVFLKIGRRSFSDSIIPFGVKEK